MADNANRLASRAPLGVSPLEVISRFQLQRRLAELPWKPSSQWYGSLLLAPLALLFGAYWGVRALARNAYGLVGLALLGALAYGLKAMDMFERIDPVMLLSIVGLGGLIAAFILIDWYREKLQYSSLFSRRGDPRQGIARRRFHVACEHIGFSPTVWHAGFDNDMFGIGVELYLRRLLIWKHGHAYIFPLESCEFDKRGTELFIKIAQAGAEGIPEVLQFRISCRGGTRSPRDWIRLFRRTARRKLGQSQL